MIRSSNGKDYDIYAALFQEAYEGAPKFYYGTIQRIKADGSDGPVIWGSDPDAYTTKGTAVKKAHQAWKRLKAEGKV